METLLIEVTSQKAYKLIKELEALHIIRVLKKTTKSKQKLSEKYAGCLSPEVADQMQKELLLMRKEWDRDIY
jgi:hypothetical protein